MDPWQAAHLMTEMFGDDAGIMAALRADHLFDQGDQEGYLAWRLVVETIKKLQTTDAPPHAERH
jgi:hypothetical protein